MKFIDNKVKKLQQGGPVEAPAPVQPAPAQQDPMQMLVEAAMAAVQNQDPNMAMEVCMMLLELVGAAPGQAPVGAPAEGQPVFRNGGRIARRVK